LDVAVVILNWNGVAHLRTYLPSVVQYSQKHQIIVADNGSTDNSVEVLRSEFPTVKIIELKENYGFCKGYNEALKQVKADIYVLLNSDVEVTENWIEPIKNLFENDSKMGACQPKLLSWVEKDKFEYAGAGGGFIDMFGYPFCRGRIFDTLETDTGQYNDTTEVMWATGACMFIKADVYHSLGGLDAFFFAHMEEIDLCWRIRNAGFKIAYYGESTVYHLGGGTLPHKNPRKTFLNFRNSLFLLYKNMPLGVFLLILLPRLVLDGIAGLKFLAEKESGHFLAVLKAHFAFYGAVFSGKVKRPKTEKKLPFKMYKGSLAIACFLFEKKRFGELIK
jgi:GT2 family glycosyltransferase